MKNRKIKKILYVFLAIILIQALCGCRAELAPNRVFSAADMPGKTVGVLTVAPAYGYVKPFSEKMDIKGYSNAAGMTEDLVSGALDCAVTDALTAESMIKENSCLKTLEAPFIDRDYRIAVSQDNTVLRDNIDSIFQTMTDDGTLEAIIDGWLSGEYEYTVSEYEYDGTITAAIDPTFSPYCFVDEDGEYSGIEIDILREICKKLNVELELIETDAENMLYLVESGKVSLAIGRIVAQEDAAVIYTDPYLTSVQVIVVRDS